MLKKIKIHELLLCIVLLILLLLPFMNSIGMWFYLRSDSNTLSGFNAWESFTYCLKATLTDNDIITVVSSPFANTINSFVGFLGFNSMIANLVTYWVSIVSGWLVFKVIFIMVHKLLGLFEKKHN